MEERIKAGIVKAFLKLKEEGVVDSVDFHIEDGELKQIVTKKQEEENDH